MHGNRQEKGMDIKESLDNRKSPQINRTQGTRVKHNLSVERLDAMH